jgi:4-amino-4-deoxy-L-arabinose transferase-like glycosyltransferase
MKAATSRLSLGTGQGTSATPSDAITRRELVLLAVVLAAGIAARGFAFARSAVEHFDEGVYASNIYAGPPEFAYPDQRFYAPPLLPALIEAGILVGLPPNVAALLPGFLAGCGTIVAVWWFGRSWFGPPVGLAAAALVGLSDFHATFSATALTDVLLGLWLVLAVDAIGRSLAAVVQSWQAGRLPHGGNGTRSVSTTYGWAIAAGVYTGLAWWTKYNGWLPLAIEGAAIPVLWFFLRPGRRELLDWIACFVLTVVVAALVWMPYYISLQSVGGYGPIAANHAKYVVGFSGWLDSAQRQMTSQFALLGGWFFLGWVLAILLPRLLQPRSVADGFVQFGRSLVEAVGMLLLTAMFVLSLGAVIGMGRQALAIHREPRLDAPVRRRAIGLVLLAVWFVAMVVATPLYTPYPRLALPLVLAACLATALNWSIVMEEGCESKQLHPAWGCVVLPGWLALGLLMNAAMPHDDLHDHPLDRRGLVTIAEQIRTTDIRREPRVVYVFGEPAIFFQLKAAGEPIVAPVPFIPAEPATKDGRPIPTLLVAGPHANRDPRFAKEWAAAKDRWHLVEEFDYEPSLVVWLDLADPRTSPQDTRDLDRVRLYRLRE